jgi:hypothetical protein
MRKLLFSLALFGTLLIPEVALTRPLDVNVSIRRQGNETYNQFLERANSLAKNTIEQRFKTDRELDALNVVVIGENNGAIAPLLAVKVNRDNWQANPNVQKWSNEFPFSQSLLGLESLPNPTAPSAAAAPPPPSAPPSDQPDAGDNFLPTGALLPEEEKTPVSWPDRRLRVGNGNPVRQQEESLDGLGVINLPPRN